MSINLPPDVEARLRDKAERSGVDIDKLITELVERGLADDESSPRYLLSLSRENRHRIMEAQFNAAAPLYAADLERPVEQRELTAFTALDGEPVLESHDHERRSDD
jgi:hypothetical protein